MTAVGQSLETYLVVCSGGKIIVFLAIKKRITSDFSALDNLTFVRVSTRDWKMGRHFPVREKSGNF